MKTYKDRYTFTIAGNHPLLLLVRNTLIQQGYAMIPWNGEDEDGFTKQDKPDFIVYGAEWHKDVSNELRGFFAVDLPYVLCDIPVLVLSSSSVYSDRTHLLTSIEKCEMDETYGHVITSPLDTSMSRPLAALTVEHFILMREARAIVVRPFNVYGPNVEHGVIHNFDKAIKGNFPLTIDAPGYQERCFLHEDDFIEGVLPLVKRLIKGSRGIYNIGSQESISIMALAKSMLQLSNKDLPLQIEESPLRHNWWKYPAIDRIKMDAKWKNKISLRTGLWRMK
jgi:nucleoside-diphosphate-sugar epimerase